MLKLNGKNIILVVLVTFLTAILVGCGGVASDYEIEIADKLEEKTGMEFEIYEMEILVGKECQANSFFQPDTGLEVYVYKYSESYVEVSVNTGNSDLQMQENVMQALEELFGDSMNQSMYLHLDMELGGH